MPDQPDEFQQWGAQRAEKTRTVDPIIKLGHPGHEYSVKFSEWRTRAQLVLEHHFILTQHLLHERSLLCTPNENADHPLCALQKRVGALLQTVSLQGHRYRYPAFSRVELGDEKLPSAPLTPQQRAEYEMIKLSTNTFKEELAKFRAVGAPLPSGVQVHAPSGVPIIPIVATRGADAGQPAPLYQTAAQRETSDLETSVAQGGAVVRAAGEQTSRVDRFVVPARSREQILGQEQQGSIEEYMDRAIEQAAAVYESCGLNQWAQDVRRLQIHSREISAADKNWMENRRRLGEIIVPMPGEEALAAEYLLALQNLKPQATIGGRRQRQTSSTFVWDHISSLATIVARVPNSLTRGMPNKPYFAVFAPTEKTPETSRSKTLDQQIQWLADQQRDATRQGIPESIMIDSCGPAEYAALQTMWTNKGGEPLDEWGWTRFIEIKKSAGGHVPGGRWNPDESQLEFVADRAGADEYAGVRLLGRVSY